MENNDIKLVCVNYKKSDSGNKVKQKLLKKLEKAVEINRQTPGVKHVHGVKTDSVLQVAFNVNYLVLLLKDGRVCRLHCSGNSEVAEDADGYEPGRESFQVASDLEYARVLQRQYDTERSPWDVTTIERDHDYMSRIDPLSSTLYVPLSHVDHLNSITVPTFDANPFEEEMATIDTPFRAHRRHSSYRDYSSRVKSFDKSCRKPSYPKFGTLEWLTIEQVCVCLSVCSVCVYIHFYIEYQWWIFCHGSDALRDIIGG